MSSSVWLAATLILAGSPSAMAQQHSHAAVSAECQQCQNGASCEDPACCLCRIRLYPDACWNPPVNMPVNYNWAWYGLSAPQAPYGAPGGGFIAQHPSVYQPTDTTQLGYYYHKVPTWQCQPGRVPGVPNPALFHARICPTNCYGAPCYGQYQHGQFTHSYAVPTLPQPLQTVSSQDHSSDTTPVVAPAPLKSVRPVSSNPETQLSKPETPAGKPLVAAKPVSSSDAKSSEQPAASKVEPSRQSPSKSATK
ncbi:MAG: hypothetical protein ACKO2P_11020, partial [Planctomycetota bacterium]